MKKIISIIISIIFLSSFSYADELSSDLDMRNYYQNKIENNNYIVTKAIIKNITYDDTNEKRDVQIEADIRYQHLEVQILQGKYKGQNLTIRHTIERIMPGYYVFKKGDKILLRITEENNSISTVKIEEKVRDTQIFLIIGLFIFLLILIGGKNGIKTILSLLITIAVIVFCYIPMIIKGFNPILSSIIISVIAIILTLLIISGKNKKTLVSIIGTSLGVICSCILSIIFGKMSHLTGLSSDSAISLAYIPNFRTLNYQGILFGTIIIGALGAIMDVAISISSSLWELTQVNNNITKKEMIISGMNIGKDMMGSMSNTLILAYVGTTLHLIILFIVYKIQFIEIINLDSISTEIIRAMAGSIGLILTIPFTVFVGTYFYKK